MTVTGKGWHLFFQLTGEGNRVGLVPKVDWRGKGGYIVAPPSVHASGRLYQWLPGLGPDADIEIVPPWLLSLLRPPARELARTVSTAGRGTDAYGRRALEAEAGRVALAPVGTRNDTLNRAAFCLGQLVAAGTLKPAEVADALYSVALRVGLSDHEATGTIASGLRRGFEHPRSRTA